MTPEQYASAVLRENCKHNDKGNVRGHCEACVAFCFRLAVESEREQCLKRCARWLEQLGYFALADNLLHDSKGPGQQK